MRACVEMEEYVFRSKKPAKMKNIYVWSRSHVSTDEATDKDTTDVTTPTTWAKKRRLSLCLIEWRESKGVHLHQFCNR